MTGGFTGYDLFVMRNTRDPVERLKVKHVHFID